MIGNQSPTTTRRTVAKGAAWTVPVIALGTSTLPASASGGAPTQCQTCFSATYSIDGASTWTISNPYGTDLNIVAGIMNSCSEVTYYNFDGANGVSTFVGGGSDSRHAFNGAIGGRYGVTLVSFYVENLDRDHAGQTISTICLTGNVTVAIAGHQYSCTDTLSICWDLLPNGAGQSATIVTTGTRSGPLRPH